MRWSEDFEQLLTASHMATRELRVKNYRLHRIPACFIASLILIPCLSAYASAQQDSIHSKLIEAARAQIGVTIRYDRAYIALPYPNGDLPLEQGVCADVVIRALRTAYGMDLQKLVHDDMTAHFSEYPKLWDLTKPDRNIDHRRVPNLQTYFRRHAISLEFPTDSSAYLPGDLVTCMLPGNLPHIMIISDKKTPSGIPLIIHNIGHGVREEDRLFTYPLTGHYRIVTN
jgi:hypothetical protein